MRPRAAREARAGLERTLDWLADGVLLVRADGTVVYANDAIRAFAEAADGIRLGGDTIELNAPTARGRLTAALADVARLAEDDVETPALADFPVPRPSGAPPYLVSIRPLPPATGGRRQEHGAVAAIFVRDPVLSKPAETRVLREAFGLTQAEADLARAVQTGVSPAAYARDRAVSLNTVYTHLRRIKEKTGAKRTPELLLKLNGARMPLRGT